MSTKSTRRIGIEFDAGAEAETLTWGNFLRLNRHTLRNLYDDGAKSPWYQVESAQVPFIDAVVLILYATQTGKPASVFLRKSLRPAVAVRRFDPLHYKVDKAELDGELWELPAGGIEPVDLAPGGGGRLARAVAEAWEEVGIRLEQSDLMPMGSPTYTCPAVTGERLYYYCAKVDPSTAQEPDGDGHPMESGSEVRLVSLPKALSWIEKGKVCDMKTEVGLMRLAHWLQKKSATPPV